MDELPQELHDYVLSFVNHYGHRFDPDSTVVPPYTYTFSEYTEWSMQPRLWVQHGYAKIIAEGDGHFINLHYRELRCHQMGNALDDKQIVVEITEKGIKFLRDYMKVAGYMNAL